MSSYFSRFAGRLSVPAVFFRFIFLNKVSISFDIIWQNLKVWSVRLVINGGHFHVKSTSGMAFSFILEIMEVRKLQKPFAISSLSLSFSFFHSLNRCDVSDLLCHLMFCRSI